ncbi:MAG TPA: ABC transporter permease [Polyangiaceae bacterium]|nr:ABC transporter permease [Polyangiaceae bacterium]
MSITSESQVGRGRAIEKTPGASAASELLVAGHEVLRQLGAAALLAIRCGAALRRRPFESKEVVRQIESLGVQSLGLTVVTSVLIGMVMGTQFAFGLSRFGGLEYLGRLVGTGFARELAPGLMAIIVGSRIGAGITAELGSMAVTEQLDAIRALGADPVKKLVLPRVLAAMIVLPIVGTFAFVLGVLGAMFAVDAQFDLPAAFFYRTALDELVIRDYLMGALKTPVFGFLIALISCYLGLETRGGTAGVGRATTYSVVATAIAILISDLLLTTLSIQVMDLFA